MSFTRTLRAVGGAVVAGALLFGTAPVASADQIRNDQWPLQKFDAESIWKISTGKGVTVAVIDGPVAGNHPDLTGSVLPGKNFVTGGRGDQGSGDEGDHGTAMASLIAGHGHGPGGSEGVKGLAPDAKILPVAINLATHDDIPKLGEETKYAEALKYAVDHGAKVVNMSFGTGKSEATAEEQQAIDYARKHDVLLVAASGNEGVGSSQDPASAPGVLAVGAVDDHGYVWDKSNYGSYLRLIAPGVHIRSASPVVDVKGKYRLANGTSDSAAYVSAAAALLRSKFPDLTAGQVANRLIKTAGIPVDKQDMKLPDTRYGFGFIKPYSALTKDVPAGSKNGPFPALKSGGSSDPSSAAGNNEAGPKIQSDKGLSMPFIILVAVVGLVVLVIVLVIVLVAKKKRRNGPPPGGPGGFGGPGGPGGPGGFVPHPPNPNNSYQQQPGGPGAYPPAPPTQPPGR
ncbi:S8 family serine peptidase [Streptomyces endophytica]|uniref:S8 family serine peptidase n=1 Tax=Streptomyces endophytica TaxID=2991496 RepID=A0ABY6P697_9ACTN|nr:S8 family serine peptidase [Streptomyces endophytica]UZJ29303.1 S8 family serine peptidase [Streptomyces endophytica]